MFKAGDRVVRTGPPYHGVLTGCIYTVTASNPGGVLMVGRVPAYFPAHFRKAWPTERQYPDGYDVLRVRSKQMVLSADAKERKDIPITTGVLDYFPLAMAAVAQVSKAGNDQHNPGQPLHWARGKSTDHHDCIARHLIDRGTLDTDGMRHSAKLAWRALAALQVELEQEKGLFLDAK